MWAFVVPKRFPAPNVFSPVGNEEGHPPPPPSHSDPQRVRMSSGERPIGAAKGKQSDTEALCPPPPRRVQTPHPPIPPPPPFQCGSACESHGAVVGAHGQKAVKPRRQAADGP